MHYKNINNRALFEILEQPIQNKVSTKYTPWGIFLLPLHYIFQFINVHLYVINSQSFAIETELNSVFVTLKKER
ncbi:MAG: hypothetical protein CMB82_05955 [Flammeovirgaceae bacterium]|nr:hypothetical protein [Flammeovirgaceae bacterium]